MTYPSNRWSRAYVVPLLFAVSSPGACTASAGDDSFSSSSPGVDSGATSGDGSTDGGAAGRGDSGTVGDAPPATDVGNVGVDAGAGTNDAGVPSGGDAGPVDCASMPLCDDFETDMVGVAPATALWSLTLGCTASTPDMAPGGGLIIGVDNTQAHSGKNSVRVVGADSCGYYFYNTSAFSKLGPQVYARFYARFTGPSTTAHTGFLSMYSGNSPVPMPDYDHSRQLRMGFQGGVIDWNFVSGTTEPQPHIDDSLPDISAMGMAASAMTAANTWLCFEFHVDQSTGHIETWLNGTSLAGPSFDGTDDTFDKEWLMSGPQSYQLQALGLGGVFDTSYTAWFDDVALSDSRIGCQ